MSKLRVALVSLHFAEYAVNLASALSKKCSVLLIVYGSNAVNEMGDGWLKQFDTVNLSILAVEQPKSLVGVFGNVYNIATKLNEFQPDVIHCQEGLRDELALLLPLFYKTPLVLTVHDPTAHSGTDTIRLRFSRYRFYRFLIRKLASKAITHGALLAKELANVCPRLEGNISAIPHGPLGKPGNLDFSVLPKEMNLLFFGRIHEYKGLKYFVDAVMELRSEGFGVTGIVAGRGRDLEFHRKRMEESGAFQILENFIPAGDVPTLFLCSRIVVLPYIDGTQSGVAAMALGFRRPVVASSVGSIPELVRHKKNGLLVSPRNTSELVSAIRSILVNDNLWVALSNESAVLRDGELSWDSVADTTLKVYLSMSK